MVRTSRRIRDRHRGLGFYRACGVCYPEVASFAKWTSLYAHSHLMSKMVNGTVGGTMSSFLKLLTNDVGHTGLRVFVVACGGELLGEALGTIDDIENRSCA